MTPKRLIENPLILNEENFLLQRHLHCVKNADIEKVVDQYNKEKENNGESWDDEVIWTDIAVFFVEHFFF